MITKRKHTMYDREFKIQAVKLLEKGGSTMSQIAKDFGVNINTLSNWRTYYTREEAKIYLFKWSGFYNTTRLHSSLGYKSPQEFEMNYKMGRIDVVA